MTYQTEEQKWDKINAKKREEIAYAQSYNLAVAIVAAGIDSTRKNVEADGLIKNKIEAWQNYFYLKLTPKRDMSMKEVLGRVFDDPEANGTI